MAKIDFMAKNESMADRIIRAVVGIVLAVLALPPTPIMSPWNYVVGLVALIVLVTAVTGSSVVYHLLGWSTLGKAKAARKAKARKKRR